MTWSRRTVLQGLAAAGVAVGYGRRAVAHSAGVVVETAQGKVRGRSVDGAQTFKGIPYAASTAGRNRFLPPQSVDPWPGIRDAIDWGCSAPQPQLALSPLTGWYDAIQPISETCLFLNVFTTTAGRSARKPVMVWLHGGGWVVGAGTATGFDGTHLAKVGDVVVVTINHRLNLFGYLALEDRGERFADSGNAGVLDMVTALRWVQQDIEAFGGDPRNVTIFGQSGGGAKVSALMGTPVAKGLFHKAIVESCSGSLSIMERPAAESAAYRLAHYLGMSRPTGEALQAVPTPHLINAMFATHANCRPMRDDRTFSRDPFDPAAPPDARDVPFMAGNAATETRLLMSVDRRNFFLSKGEVTRRVARFLQIGRAETLRILDIYRAVSLNASPSDLLAQVTTDYMYVRNTRREALLQAQDRRAPVYTYLFNWRTPVMDGLLRSPHEVEVPFVFGTAAAAGSYVGAGPAIAPLTKMMIATWSAFAHTGNPVNPLLPHWPRYSPQEKLTMVLDLASTVQRDPGGQTRKCLESLPVYEYSMPINFQQA